MGNLCNRPSVAKLPDTQYFDTMERCEKIRCILNAHNAGLHPDLAVVELHVLAYPLKMCLGHFQQTPTNEKWDSLLIRGLQASVYANRLAKQGRYDWPPIVVEMITDILKVLNDHQHGTTVPNAA